MRGFGITEIAQIDQIMQHGNNAGMWAIQLLSDFGRGGGPAAFLENLHNLKCPADGSAYRDLHATSVETIL
jgi:hypothetical protein